MSDGFQHPAATASSPKKAAGDPDTPFSVTPEEIVFRSFKPNTTYEALITFKNRSKKCAFLRVSTPESHVFSLTAPKAAETSMKVACGLTVTYTVLFTPDANKDYVCELNLVTDEGLMTVPLRAYADRGRLTLPDAFEVEPTPVKGSLTSTLFLRNEGEKDCIWKASVDAPFCVFPPFGSVPCNGGLVPVEVHFAPFLPQKYQSSIRFFLGPDGDVVQELPVSGQGLELDIRMDRSLKFMDTFVTREHQRVVKVSNESNYTVHFCWRKEGEAQNTSILDEIENASNTYLDTVFSIEPCAGVIYGRGAREFTVTFNPLVQSETTTTAYLDISGRAEQLPLLLSGKGLGPRCKLEFAHLNVGDIYINELHEYEVYLENTSPIETVYTVLPPETLMSRKFTFTPDNGVLLPGASQLLKIQLQSDLIGSLNETFPIHLHGCTSDLTIQFKGRVLGPIYHFDIRELDFGNVSYNFWHSRTFSISNTSRIPMKYSLHLLDGSPFAGEFKISPSEGLIPEKHAQVIQVDFLSNTVGEYDTAIVLDLEDVGDAVDSLPLKAFCMVPRLYLTTNKISFGRCFVGYDYVMNLEVANDTSMCGKFEIKMVATDELKEKVHVSIGDPTSDTPIHILEPHSHVQVPIALCTKDIGNINFSLALRVLGSSLSESDTALVLAASRGPVIEFQPSSVSFGRVKVLEHAERTLVLTNTSPIEACINIGLTKARGEDAVFQIEPTSAVIQPFDKLPVKVSAFLDEAMAFKNFIDVDIKYSPNSVPPIPIKAHGDGFALVPDVDLADFQFHDVFTDCLVSKEVVITNQGRKNQEIQWLNTRGSKAKEGAPPIIFKVQPERGTILARSSTKFVISGISSEKGEISECFQIKQCGTSANILTAHVSANFITPLIAYSSKSLPFEFIQGIHDITQRQTKTFTMKNTTSMSVDVVLRLKETKTPFRIEEPVSFTLEQGETHVVGVSLNPDYRHDLCSHTVKNKVMISFIKLSQTESVNLTAKMMFPSVSIEPSDEVNFGTILKDTEMRAELVLRNDSAVVPAQFHWKLLKNDGNPAVNTVKEEMDSVDNPTTKIFDFIPFKGFIPPGESKHVEAVFYGASGQYEVLARCDVEGGPSSSVKLLGAAGDVQIHYDRTSLDFGAVPYYSSVSKTITISNPSKVSVNFVTTCTLRNANCLTISPTSGKFKDKLRLQVTFTPLVPDDIEETMSIHIGHFDPQVIRITGRGQLNTLFMRARDNVASISRVMNDTYKALYEELQEVDRSKRIPYLTKISGLTLPHWIDPLVLEAERQSFCLAVRNYQEKKKGGLAGASASTLGFDNRVTPDEKTYPLRFQIRRNSASARGSTKHVLARYLVDFGHMTRNETKTVQVGIVNTCSDPLVLILDSKEIQKTPLSINPIKPPKIPPLGEEFFSISLNASQMADEESFVKVGENIFEFAIDIREGPVVLVECRCYVATPLLRISDTLLDFGSLLLGRTKILPLTLINDQAVPCEWRLTCRGSKLSLTASLDLVVSSSPQFWVNIDHGVLPPNETVVLEVFFAPVVERNLAASLFFRFMNNNRTAEVKLRGAGRAYKVSITPTPFVIPSVRPVQVTHQSIRITNSEPEPVEVYACGLDVGKRSEMQLLETCLSMIEGGRMIYPLRIVGEGFDNEMLEFAYRLLYDNQNELLYINDTESSPRSIRNGYASGTEPVAGLETEELRDQQKKELPSMAPYMVLLLGPPQAGKTLQATLLQEELGLQLVDLNDLLEEEAEKDTAMGELIRNALTLRGSQRPPTPVESHLENSLYAEDFNLTNQLTDAKLFSGTLSKSGQANPFEPPSREVEHTPSTARPTSVRGRVKVDSVSPQAGELPTNYQSMLPSIVRQLLRMFIRRATVHHARGYIIDDLTCALTSDKTLLYSAIEELCESMRIPLHVVTLGVSEPMVGLRYATILYSQCSDRVQNALIEPISEEEYDKMSSISRYEFNRKLQYLNDCKRELNAARKKKEKYEQILLQGPQPSIPVEIQEKILNISSNVAQRGSKKPRMSIAANLLPQVDWEGISPLDSFKELYTHIAKDFSEELSETVKFYLINGEQAVDRVTDEIFCTILEKQEEEPMSSSVKSSLGSIQNSVKAFSENEKVTRFGEWEYMDFERLRYLMNRQPAEYLRFFSKVERELLIAKKGMKGKQGGSTTLVHRNEELTRWIIPSNSYVDVSVEFCSDRNGVFAAECLFGVNSSLQTLSLQVTAQIALPDMCRDETKIFPSVKGRQLLAKLGGKVYISSKRLFDFGPLLVPAPAGAKARAKLTKERSNSMRGTPTQGDTEKRMTAEIVWGSTEILYFENKSISPAEISLSFLNEKDKTFTVSPSKFTLDVGGKQEVALRAAPETVGELHNRLIAVVKENPTPWQVNVSCIGSRPSLTIDDQKEVEIDFGREVINRVLTRVLTLVNVSRMPIQWKLIGVEKLPVDILVGEWSGILEENGSFDLTVTFAPVNTCLHTSQLQVIVIDPNAPSIIYEVLPVLIKAEGHDVVLEWTKEVDFKLMHVGETKKEYIKILNKSPYDVSYLFRLPHRLQHLVSISPPSGTIRGMVGYKDSALAVVEVTGHFDREGEIPKRLSQIEATFYNSQENILLYPTQIIPLRGEAWYTKFSIKPDNIYFGSCFFNQRNESTFEIRNTGRFPVHFTLFDYNEGCKELAEAARLNVLQEGAEESPPGVKKNAKGKSTEAEFKIGCFTVVPCRGVVEVGEVLSLTVATCPQVGSRVKEVLGVFVEQSDPETEARGTPITLTAQPATPGIAADLSVPSDVDIIFEEQQVLFRLDQLDKSAKGFSREDRAFSFGTILVGHEVEERFRIANTSPLPCHVMVQLQSTTSCGKAVANPECFEIVSKELESEKGSDVFRFLLPPFESRFVSVVFKPTSLQRYEGRFVAIVENGTDPRTNQLSFQMVGCATLPNVEYILPPSLKKSGANQQENLTPKSIKGRSKESTKKTSPTPVVVQNDTIEMPLTRYGAVSSRLFTIKNCGTVSANIRISLVSPEVLAAGLSMMRRNTNIHISAGEEETFEVNYAPTSLGKAFMKLHISLADNPFENKELNVEGQSYHQDISFDGIDPVSLDFLTVGDCYQGEPKTVEFVMRNNTNKDVRFVWCYPHSEPISFSPSEGHLRAFQTKNIAVTVCAAKMGLLRTIPCEVETQNIIIPENIDWDSSMMDQKWVLMEEDGSAQSQDLSRRNLKRTLEPVPEPLYYVTDDPPLDVPLTIGYSCNQPSFELHLLSADGKTLPLESITYPKTKIFQRRIVTLLVQNTGSVTLPYVFSMESETALGEAPPAGCPSHGEVFSLDSSSGEIPTGASKKIQVIFSPLTAEAVSTVLRCEFPFTKRKPIRIPITGTGECPLIHFNLPHSEYLANRVDGEAGPITDPETVVIEFLTRGLHTSTTVKFKVINPTFSTHQFEWAEESNPDYLTPFRCINSSGSIAAGKQSEMGFEFSGNYLGLRESKWTFNILGKGAVSFLLVGRTVEPDVVFSTSKLNFGSISLGTRSDKEILLENRDEIPFNFRFDKAVLATTPFLSVKPLQGIVAAKEKLPIRVSFFPKDEQEYNMPLVCAVKRASIPLTVNVKGEGFTIHESLALEQPGEEEAIVLQRGQPLTVHLGRVQLHDKAVRHFLLTNTGRFSFEYAVAFPNKRFLQIENIAGTVLPKKSAIITVTYKPTAEDTLVGCRLMFKISDKVAYQVTLQGMSYVPKLFLSFEKFDFGPRFTSAYSADGVTTAVLSVVNAEKDLLSVDCSQSEGNDWMVLDCNSFVIKPNESKDIRISFLPTETRLYDDQLKLLINGVYPIMIPISGEGVIPRVEVLNHFCKFGVLRVGEKRDAEVRVECHSRIPTPISFYGCFDDDFQSKGVSITSGMQYLLKPKEVRVIHLQYFPQKRMRAFQRELKMMVCDREAPFSLITGACEDSEIHLDIMVLKFSDVVVGSSSSSKIVVMNSGDVSQKFTWNTKAGSEIQITPSSGFVRSHTEYICEMKYCPIKAGSVLQKSVTIEFDHSPPIAVHVEGNCIGRPPVKGKLSFRCRARETQELKMTVENTSSQPWVIRPELDLPVFTSIPSVTVKGKGRCEIPITYAPLKVTPEDEPDECVLFVSQADGTGQTFLLEGIADEPGPSGPCKELELETKASGKLTFVVKNWYKKSSLRFTREIEWIADPGELVMVKGPSGVDVAPESSSEYAVSFQCLQEGVYRGKMFFHCYENPDLTQYYEFRIKSVTPPTLESIQLLGAVRSQAIHNVKLNNPLHKPVTVTCKVEGGSSEAITAPASLVIPAKSEGVLPIEFFPLVHREYNPIKIQVVSPELGSSTYIVKPVSSAPPPEKLTQVVCPLGQSVTFPLRFTNYCRNNTEYAVSFTGDQSLTGKNAVFTKVGQGSSIKAQGTSRCQEIVTEFVFEPHAKGLIKEIIEFTSPIGGVYTFPIIAHCTEPQRQGPFTMRTGQSTSVPFKNVFLEPVSISVTTDSPSFIVTKKSESVAAKKTVNIVVQCKSEETKETIRGKLLISCTPPGEKQPMEWVYYLEGGNSETASRRSQARASSTRKKTSSSAKSNN